MAKCPPWCAGAHQCTARQLPSGEHVSTPAAWTTIVGKVVATRYQRAQGGHVEIRFVVPLPEDETEAVDMMRLLIAGAYDGISRAIKQST